MRRRLVGHSQAACVMCLLQLQAKPVQAWHKFAQLQRVLVHADATQLRHRALICAHVSKLTGCI